jgi:hypothetical protein
VFLNNKASYYSHVSEIRSVQEVRFGVPKTLTLKLASKATAHGRCVKLCMHHIKHDIPVFLMFRALGVESDAEIVRCIVQVTFSLSGGGRERSSRPLPRKQKLNQNLWPFRQGHPHAISRPVGPNPMAHLPHLARAPKGVCASPAGSGHPPCHLPPRRAEPHGTPPAPCR